MRGYDVIGDVHGCADKLEDLLGELGYRPDPWTGTFSNRTRMAIFVGDLIDRGEFQLQTLKIVKAMVDAGSAQMVMGNHEFNAIAYATPDPQRPGEYLREHSSKNMKQHRAFLWQLTESEQFEYLTWFRTLPLWLDLGELRVVHACWHQPSINRIERALGGNRFKSLAQFSKASSKSTSSSLLYQAVEVILKGPELSLVDYGADPFHDKDHHVRGEARVRWWKAGGATLSDLAEVPKGHVLPSKRAKNRDRSYSYNDEVPVFYGHYWRSDEPVEHEDWTTKTACVDFSAVKGGTMVAYRWSGESEIDPRHYHPYGANIVSPSPSS